MHILHVLDHSLPLHSGYTFRTMAILRQQRALGWTTSHLTSAKQADAQQQVSAPAIRPASRHDHRPGHQPDHQDEDRQVEHIDGWRFYRTAPAAGWSRLPLLGQLSIIAGLSARLLALAQQLQPDILHAHSPALNAVAALRVGRRLGIPVVYECRAFWEDAAVDHGTTRAGGLRYRLTRALESYALRRADAITTICEGLRRDISGRGIAAARITVIPNAVDLLDFPPDAGRDQALLRRHQLEGNVVLGFIGSFYAYEGLALLLQALPLMLPRCPTLRLLLVGGGFQQVALQALAQRLGLEQYVVFVGRVPHAQVRQYYALIDVLVYPRLPMRLTDLVTPLKPLEAMAQGRLVVASDVGGHREMIANGKTGILFEAGNRYALAEAVLGLLERVDTWPALRLAAREYVRSERNWATSVAGYAAVYARVQAQRPAAAVPA